MKFDLHSFNTTQLSLLLLAGAMVAAAAAAATSNTSTFLSANGASVVYNVLAEGRTAVWLESALIDAIDNPNTGCGVQSVNATQLNLTNPATLFTKKISSGNLISLQAFGITSATNPSTAECLINEIQQLAHKFKHAGDESPADKALVLTYIIFVGVLMAITVVALAANNAKLARGVTAVTDALGLTTPRQRGDVESQSLIANAGASAPARSGYGASQ